MRAFVLMSLVLGVAACGGTPTAAVVMGGRDAPPAQVGEGDPALARQLTGHLRRVEGCFDLHRTRAALVEVSFTIEPDGHVDDVTASRESGEGRGLGECIRGRLSGLYFDPAPGRPIAMHHRFARCEHAEGGLCMLGPAERVGAGPAAHQRAVEALFEAQGAAIGQCQAEVRAETEQLVEVEVTVGEDGRVMTGRITDAAPADGPAVRCALRPLLGAKIEGETPSAPVRYRRLMILEPFASAP